MQENKFYMIIVLNTQVLPLIVTMIDQVNQLVFEDKIERGLHPV